MQINQIAAAYDAYMPTERVRKVERKDVGTPKRDEVTTSALAKEYQNVRNALATVPDVRADKVAALKARIESGSYNVEAHEVASKMMAMFGNDLFA